jgi:Poly(ADP-ribose) polymerase, regulatory domain
MEICWDLQRMKKAMEETNLDVARMPVGSVKREQIEKAMKILSEVVKLLLTNPGKELQFVQLTNDFLTVIPHNYGIKKAVNIDHLLRVKEKLKMLEMLSDIEIAQKAMISSLEDFRLEHPIDVLYK